jgi:hypothetical protein
MTMKKKSQEKKKKTEKEGKELSREQLKVIKGAAAQYTTISSTRISDRMTTS